MTSETNAPQSVIGPTQSKATDAVSILQRIQKHWMAGAIHDLSTPLFVARGYVRMALASDDNQLPSQQKQYLKRALDNINLLVTLTGTLHDFPQPECFAFETVDLSDLLDRAEAAAESALREKQLRFTMDTRGNDLCTIGDTRLLTTAIQAFVGAAIHAASPGGLLEVEGREEAEIITLTFRAKADPPTAIDQLTFEVQTASRLWRLHGGSTVFSVNTNEETVMRCELPVLRQSEC